MEFGFTEEQIMLKEMATDFAQKEIAPFALENDKKSYFPWEVIRKMGDLGLLGIMIPEEYGGSNMGTVAYCLVMEEIAKADASVATGYSTYTLTLDMLLNYGTEEQKKKYIPPLVKGERIPCFALTEPGVGSDAAGLQTIAALNGNEWVLNGRKCFITHAEFADFALIFALTDKEKKTKGITCFIVPDTKLKGYSIGKTEDKMGQRALHISEIFMDNLRLPDNSYLGELNKGFYYCVNALNSARIGIACIGIGVAQAAFEESLKYSDQRVQFGYPIKEYQAIQWYLADMATDIQAARMMTYYAAYLKDSGKPYIKEAAMAKLFASEKCMRICKDAVQIHGAYGYMKDYPVEKYFRDAKVIEIYEGPSEIQRIIISKQVLKEFAK